MDKVVSTVSSDKGGDCVSKEWKANPTFPPFLQVKLKVKCILVQALRLVQAVRHIEGVEV